MWLDRLSSHSTPSASPPSAARRPVHLAPTSAPQRPGFSPRASSLSLVSNDSTTSLLSSSRKPNGSALKQSVTIVDAPDPLVVLKSLLTTEKTDSELSASTKPVVKDVKPEADLLDSQWEVDFDGRSLQDLASAGKAASDDVHLYRTQTVEECMYYPWKMCCILLMLKC